MPSVGPELPPRLAKRKRSIGDAEPPNSPPRKVQAAIAPQIGPTPPPKNHHELDVGEDSEDDYGPLIPSKLVKQPFPPRRMVGPALPPSNNPDELDVDGSSEDDYGPSLQPSKPTSQTAKRVLGPAPPPASLSELPPHPPNDSSDSDDGYGPSLPPPPGSHAETTMLSIRAQEASLAASKAAQESSKPQRAEWMLVPPTSDDWTSRVDPTKLKNRKFASGKGAKAPAERSGISAIWTETPEQKRQRIKDEVLGRKDAATSSRASKVAGDGGGKGESREERETARRIQEYNERNRGKSLFEEHKGKGEGVGKEDDPSKRGFDREKDMALGGRLGHGEKREMLAKAKGFGERFERGKYL